MILSLTACVEEQPVHVNVSNSENLSSSQLGVFVTIGNNLVYDTSTRVVYIKNITYHAYVIYTPYYAPNGLPYRYNPETNTFEEISQNE